MNSNKAGRRASQDELRQAQSTQNYNYLWQQALPLVKHAIKLLKRKGLTREERDDLYQEGNLAAGSAVRNWDPDSGAAFSTWVTVRVTGALRNHLARARHGVVGTRDTYIPTAAVYEDRLASRAASHEVALQEEQVSEQVRVAIGKLSEIEAVVVRARWGLDDDDPVTLPALARREGVPLRSIERIAVRCVEKLAGLLRQPGELHANRNPRFNHVYPSRIASPVPTVGLSAPQLADDIQ